MSTSFPWPLTQCLILKEITLFVESWLSMSTSFPWPLTQCLILKEITLFVESWLSMSTSFPWPRHNVWSLFVESWLSMSTSFPWPLTQCLISVCRILTQYEYIIPMTPDTKNLSLYRKRSPRSDKYNVKHQIPNMEDSVSIRPQLAVSEKEIEAR